jgi:hypothetical protein
MYMIRVFNADGNDIGITSVDTVAYDFYTDPIKVITLPDASLAADTEYIVQLYAVNDLDNTGLPLDIYAVSPQGGASNPSAFDAAYQRTLRIRTVGPGKVQLGDIWTAPANNKIRLNFEDAVGLDNIKYIQYTVYKDDATYTYSSNALIPFAPTSDASYDPPLQYFVLPNPTLTNRGLYYVSVDFYAQDMTTKLGDASVVYRVN